MTVAASVPALIVPAAGAGSRLGAGVPKFMRMVGGASMIEHLVELYEPFVSQFVCVVNPAHIATAEALVSASTSHRVDVVAQAQPTGMLDAILLARPAIEASHVARVWITWCDQIAIELSTINRLASSEYDGVDLVFPTVVREAPYIHFDRDHDGRLTGVRQRREGDAMPAVGEGDVGLFSLSRRAFLDVMPDYATRVSAGAGTGERNMLPFIPWLAARASVETFPCTDPMEAIGINTPEELHLVEAHLGSRRNR